MSKTSLNEKERRTAAFRKELAALKVKNLTALDPFTVLAKIGNLVDVSSTGILLLIGRRDLIPKNLRTNLSLASIEGEKVCFRIEEMDLELDGTIARTRYIGDEMFEVAVDFSDNAPEYWRECLVELLPGYEES